MIWRKIMNNKHQENGALTDPLIFTLSNRPARGGFIPSVSNFNYHLGGKRLTARSLQTIATLAAALLVMTVASRVWADEVTRWNKIATDASAVANTNPLIESCVFSMLHVAIHDAVNAVESRNEPYQPRTSPAPVGASVEAAIAVLKSSDQFRCPEPPSVNSSCALADLEEVEEIGGSKSVTRTPEQSEIGRFWYESSPQGWNRIAREVSATRQFDVWENARLFALVNLAMADGYIAGFERPASSGASLKQHEKMVHPVSYAGFTSRPR